MIEEIVHSPITSSPHYWVVTHKPYPRGAQLRDMETATPEDRRSHQAFVLVGAPKSVTMRASFRLNRFYLVSTAL